MKKTFLMFVIVSVVVAVSSFSAYFFITASKKIGTKSIETKNQEKDVVSYISCGCGCCGFDKPLEEIAKVECLYKAKGEDIQDKISSDKQLSANSCATVGCSFPVKYKYCD